MPIDFDYASCTRAIGDDAPEMLLERPVMNADTSEVVPLPGNNFSLVSDSELDDTIERYKRLIEMNLDLHDKSTKLQMRLEALQTEKGRRNRAPKTRTLEQLDNVFQQRSEKPEKPERVYFEPPSDANKCSPPRIPKEREAVQRTTADPNPLKFHCFKRRKLCVPRYETSDSEQEPEPAAKAQVVRSAPRTRASRRAEAVTGGTPDSAVVLFSSDDEGAECREATLFPAGDGPARRTSSRLSLQRMRDQSFKIAFPSRDDPDAVEVYYQDLNHLKPAEFLNDTVIDFYIKFLQNTEFEDPERRGRFYFYNSFFFKKLGEAMDLEDKQKQTDAFSKLRKWTRGVDIFQMSYLLIPINDKFHWSLAIVGFSLSGDDHIVVPYIYHLDSLESGHNSRNIFRCLQRYLEMEHEHTKNLCRVAWKSIVTKRVEVPRQDNEYDCGLFLLYYIKRFIADAPLPCKLSNVTLFGRRWFRPMEASGLRAIIRELLLNLFDES